MEEPEIVVRAEPGTIEDRLRDPLEKQLTSALRAAIHRLADDVVGMDVAEVVDWLVAETRDGLHPDIAARFEPSRYEMAAIAGQLARGETPTFQPADDGEEVRGHGSGPAG
ncbi:MAG TPA: hypothetical protein VGN37_03665 [Actinocatenispora sp.]